MELVEAEEAEEEIEVAAEEEVVATKTEETTEVKEEEATSINQERREATGTKEATRKEVKPEEITEVNVEAIRTEKEAEVATKVEVAVAALLANQASLLSLSQLTQRKPRLKSSSLLQTSSRCLLVKMLPRFSNIQLVLKNAMIQPTMDQRLQ